MSQRSINEGTEEKRKRKKRDGAGGDPRNESEKERKGSEMLSYYFGIPGDEGEGMGVKEGYFASIWFLLLLSDIHTSVYSLIVCYSFIRIYAEAHIFSLSLSLVRTLFFFWLILTHAKMQRFNEFFIFIFLLSLKPFSPFSPIPLNLYTQRFLFPPSPFFLVSSFPIYTLAMQNHNFQSDSRVNSFSSLTC